HVAVGSHNLSAWEALAQMESSGVYHHACEGSARYVRGDDGQMMIEPDHGRLTLEIDLSYPVDVLVELVKELIQKAQGEHPRRRRPDKADFYLSVYDRVVKGEKFDDIAAIMGKPVSTIKSAWAMASYNIFGPEAPSRKTLMRGAFNSETHFK